MWIHLLALGQIDGASSGVVPPAPTTGSNGFAGDDRGWFSWKGKNYYLTHDELAYMLREETELERQSLKVKKKKKVRTVSPQVWAEIMTSLEKLNDPGKEPIAEVTAYEEPDDDEEAMELLLAYI